VDAGLIPTGEFRAVGGTPFDFRQSTAIGARIEAQEEATQARSGLRSQWVLNRAGDRLSLVARVEEPSTGREVLTTQANRVLAENT
jgi:aldose 1-epimerase